MLKLFTLDFSTEDENYGHVSKVASFVGFMIFCCPRYFNTFSVAFGRPIACVAMPKVINIQGQ